MLGHIAVYRGELDEAERHLSAAETAVEQTGPWPGTDFMIWGRGLLHEARGEIPQALEAMEIAWEVAEPVRYLLAFRTLGPRLVRLAKREGSRDLLEAVVGGMAEGARRSSVVSAQAAARHSRALFEDDADALVHAVELYRTTPRPLELAQAAEGAAELLAAAGRRDEAPALLDEALRIYEELDAGLCAARALAALRAIEAAVVRAASGVERRVAGTP